MRITFQDVDSFWGYETEVETLPRRGDRVYISLGLENGTSDFSGVVTAVSWYFRELANGTVKTDIVVLVQKVRN
jgi:hypothetical protein